MLLAVFIPAVIALNEIASFLGISYTLLRNTNTGKVVLAIGFRNQHDQSLWTFFTSLTLALLTAYQAINFCFAFFRIAKAFIMQRRIETTSSDEAYLFKGIAWIAGGLKLGAIDSVVGFAQGGFGGALTRRILRFLSRAFLCIGIVKGIDGLEDFDSIRREMSQSRDNNGKRDIRNFISNPRFSTFQELTPTATQFHTNPRALDAQQRAETGLNGMAQLRSFKDKDHDRVTIHYEKQGAPSLHMRFSALDLPSPRIIVEKVKSQLPSPEWTKKVRASSYYPSSEYTADVDPDVVARTPIYARHTRALSAYSADSLQSSFRDLAQQFPDIPPPPPPAVLLANASKPVWEDPYPSSIAVNKTSLSRGNSQATMGSSGSSGSIKRKPVPAFDEHRPNRDLRTDIPQTATASTPYAAYNSANTVEGGGFKIAMTTTSSPSGYTPSPHTESTPYVNQTPSSLITTPENDLNPFQYDSGRPMSTALSGKSLQISRDSRLDFGDALERARLHRRSVSQPALLPSLQEEDGASRNPSPDPTVDRIKQTEAISSRIKSIGRTPKRYTPAAVKPGMTRGSIHIEPIMIPPRAGGMPEIDLIQEESEVGEVSLPF